MRSSGQIAPIDQWGSHGPHCWRLSVTKSDGSGVASAAAASDAVPPQPAISLNQGDEEDMRALEVNRAAIAANAAQIQALYDELEADLQKAM